MPEIIFEDWHLIDYAAALSRQRTLFDEALERKNLHEEPLNRWCFCEHPPVFTMGKHAKESNVLVSERFLAEKGIGLFHIERGGDVTFHGPSQIVCYPILDLESFHMGLREYIYLLEEVVIRTLAEYDVHGGRVDGASGVWLEPDSPRARKICAVGVKSSRFVTMHGLAFNINTDLKYFTLINPCGFVDKQVTSLQQELGHRVPLDEVKIKMREQVLHLFGLRLR